MKNLSLKMDDIVFRETEKILTKINKNRNRYINEAVEFYNLLQKRKILSRQLQKESKLVQEESMKVLAEGQIRDEVGAPQWTLFEPESPPRASHSIARRPRP